MVTPMGPRGRAPILGHVLLEGVRLKGLIDTGASISCLGNEVYQRNCDNWGPLEPYGSVVRGPDGDPLPVVGQTRPLHLRWGEASTRIRFVVIVGLKEPPALLGMDLMAPLNVHINARAGEAAPLAADSPCPVIATALESTQLPPESVCFVRCANPWPEGDVLFDPGEGLPFNVSCRPSILSGADAWVAVFNHHPQP